jgi:hypothetical protein
VVPYEGFTVPPLSTPPKSAQHRQAALARWGGGRIVRLDALDPHVRAAVLALVRADEAARQAVDDAA